jgi:predicted MFS family arabinose efflux permease
MLGWYNAIGSAFGAGIGIVSGFVAVHTSSWTNVYYLYLVTVPILVLVVLFVPTTPADRAPAEVALEARKAERVPVGPLVALLVAAAVFSVVYQIPSYEISLFVAQQGLGDASTAGIVSAAMTIGSAIGCVLLGVVYRLLGRITATVAWALMVVGLVVLATSSTVVLAWAGCLVIGVAYGIGFVYYTVQATATVPQSRITLALALAMTATSIGGFASTYVFSWLLAAFDAETVSAVMPTLIGTAVVGAVFAVGFGVRARRRGVTEPAPFEVVPKQETV